MANLRKVFGKQCLSRMQQALKYWQGFRGFYSLSSPRANTDGTWAVFCIDGRTIHGGLSDRLRGLLSTYLYCKECGRGLVINWVYPFRLSDYLELKESATNVKWGGI